MIGKSFGGRLLSNALGDKSKEMEDKGSKLEEETIIYNKATQRSRLNHLTFGSPTMLLNLQLKVWTTLLLTHGLPLLDGGKPCRSWDHYCFENRLLPSLIMFFAKCMTSNTVQQKGNAESNQLSFLPSKDL